MPHRIMSPKTLKEMKDSIGYYKNLILRIKEFKRGDSNAIKSGMEAIREMEFDSGYRKSQFLKMADPISMTKAHGLQMMQEAYQNVITMFEAPDSSVDVYQEEITKMQTEINKYEPRQPDQQQ